MRITVVCSNNADCPDTLRALAFFMRQGLECLVEIVKQDTPRAKVFWEAASHLLAGKKGHPLVCLFREGSAVEVDWAASEPTIGQLTDGLTTAGHPIYVLASLPDTMEVCCSCVSVGGYTTVSLSQAEMEARDAGVQSA
jgi:hypothetical protein